MIPAALIGKMQGSKDTAKQILTGDLAVVRHNYVKKGKGRGKNKKPDKAVDVEYHVNPVSIGIGVLAIGAAATTAAIALWMAGMGLQQSNGSTKIYTVRNTGTAGEPNWYLYSQRGVPIKRFGATYTNDNILSATKNGQGWYIDSTTVSKDGSWVGIVAKNDGKKSWSLNQRGRFSINILSSTGGGSSGSITGQGIGTGGGLVRRGNFGDFPHL